MIFTHLFTSSTPGSTDRSSREGVKRSGNSNLPIALFTLLSWLLNVTCISSSLFDLLLSIKFGWCLESLESKRCVSISDAMEMASISSSPRTVEEIFKDYSGRRAGVVRALTYGTRIFPTHSLSSSSSFSV